MLSIIDKAYPVFSSPYGDCTRFIYADTDSIRFSSPYGDCIRMTTPKYPVMELSPPYGDDTMDFYYWGIVNLFSLPYGAVSYTHLTLPTNSRV